MEHAERLLACHKSRCRRITPTGSQPWTSCTYAYLSLLPYLAPAFSALRFICSSIAQAKASKLQLEALAQSIAQFLKTLDGEYRARRLA
jgi:hypothetical protein